MEGQEHQAGGQEAWARIPAVPPGPGQPWASPFFSLGPISCGFRLGLRVPGVPGWVGNKEGKDRKLHRPGTCVLGGNLQHFY